MQFEVPQFIEVEDKIGPLTFKQWIFVLGGSGLMFIVWFALRGTLGNFLSAIIGLPLGLFLGAFGFNIMHKREPFIKTVENGIKYYLGKRVFIWQKKHKAPKKGDRASDTLGSDPLGNLTMPKLSDSKLKEISWGLDINEALEEQPQQDSTIDRVLQDVSLPDDLFGNR